MDEKVIKVSNRDSGSVGYVIPDTGVRRRFMPGESKMIPLSEIQQLQYIPGGEYMLKHLLLIEDENALAQLNMQVEPEYFYKKEDVQNLLQKGTLDQVKDCLDFAPEGVIEIMKKEAVDSALPDTQKREAIFEKTGFNVDTAININKMLDAEDGAEAGVEAQKQTGRRTAPPTKPTTQLPKYNVVKTGK